MKENLCVCCGKSIPEGQLVCPVCEENPSKISTTKLLRLGDDAYVAGYDGGTIDCSSLGYFDELEEEIWTLVRKYAEQFGLVLENEDGEPADAPSFDLAKDVQNVILNMFIKAGIKFNFS